MPRFITKIDTAADMTDHEEVLLWKAGWTPTVTVNGVTSPNPVPRETAIAKTYSDIQEQIFTKLRRERAGSMARTAVARVPLTVTTSTT